MREARRVLGRMLVDEEVAVGPVEVLQDRPVVKHRAGGPGRHEQCGGLWRVHPVNSVHA